MLGHIKDPVDGTATLAGYTETGRRHRSSVEVIAKVTLHAPALGAIPVEVTLRVPKSELPLAAGRTWNVRFDRTEPSNMDIAWAVTGTLPRDSEHEMERQLSRDEVRVLEATRRRGSK
ncbi:MAG: hypothetical protein WCB51_15365 [Candidatus Dormiibacterota bacterium]